MSSRLDEPDAITELIRRETARLRALRDDAGAQDPSAPAVDSRPRLLEDAPPISERSAYALHELLAYQDAAFVRNAYRAVLQRAADPEGFETFLQALRTGAMSKLEIVGRLRYSHEGRARGVQVRGLALPLTLRMARRIPVVGYLVALLEQLVRLPEMGRRHDRLESAVFQGLAEMRRAFNEAQSHHERQLGQLVREHAGLAARLVNEQRRLDAHDAALRAGTEAIDRHLATKADTADVRTLAARVDRLVRADEPLDDALYAALEERFRGSEQDVAARLAIYVPVLHAAGAGTAARPILDVGTGRGEWLTLLARHGMVAKGVDRNAVLVARGRSAGLDVATGDGIDELGRHAPDALGAVTAFHVVEHLTLDALLALLRSAHRALQPDGVLILETPNPENVVIGACNFHLDPTHRRPLPPPLLEFLADACGFVDIDVWRLHPVVPPQDPAPAIDDARFNGPQDYALLARKPARRAAA